MSPSMRGNCDLLRPYVTGSNGAILSEVGQTKVLSLVGHIRDHGLHRDTALGHLPVVWISMTIQGWRLSFHKGLWRFHDRSLPHCGMIFGYYYGLPDTNAGEHSYGGSFGYLSTENVLQAFGLNTLKRFNQPMRRGGNVTPRGDLFARFSTDATT
jgi:hypothetical protein